MENNDIKEIAQAINKLKSEKEILQFLSEILTQSELTILSKRWRILNMLNSKVVQREIAKSLNVSLCKVTRGARILKKDNSIVKKYLNVRKG